MKRAVEKPFRCATDVIGCKVVSPEGDEVGMIEEVVLHVPHGLIAYAVLSCGGFLGFGNTLFAMPWSALSPREGQESAFQLHVTREQLAQAPGFDRNEWPDMVDLRWCSQVDAWYRTTYTNRIGLRPV